MKDKSFCVKAVLFDFDGTLTKPGAIDFSSIRRAIGCPPERPILEFIDGLNDSVLKRRMLATLLAHETEAAAESEPNEGAEELIAYLRARHIKTGIITRNSLQSVERAIRNFRHISESDFDLIISRDDPVAIKPSADGVLLAAERLGTDAKDLLVVGDFIFDIQAANRAGAVSVFLSNGRPPAVAIPERDFTISHLLELKEVVRLGRPLPAGKLPNDLLRQFIGGCGRQDVSVLIHPGVGEDVAAVDVDGEEILVLKSDPITFATDAIGRYAVLVNANDIATAGAVPRWLLTSLLFPCNTTAAAIRQVMHELQGVCRECGITLCGGHTEITDAVTRPVVTGMLAGTVARKDLIDKRNLRTDDVILLTKGVCVEGTAIIAREFKSRLRALKVSAAEIETCRQFLSRISVLEEARIAAGHRGVSAMHDVTEGGLATALEELSIAGRHRIGVDMDRIPVYDQTRRLCRLLGIDPLGLIGSGSLLIACRQESHQDLIGRIRAAGIEVTRIGEVLEPGQGIAARNHGERADWPRFRADEITRLYNAPA